MLFKLCRRLFACYSFIWCQFCLYFVHGEEETELRIRKKGDSIPGTVNSVRTGAKSLTCRHPAPEAVSIDKKYLFHHREKA